jgi:hypothetical protein
MSPFIRAEQRSRKLNTTPPIRPARAPDPTITKHAGRRRLGATVVDRLDPLLVAVRDFEVTYNGRREVIRAARDRIRSTHPIVRAHPDAFALPPKEGQQQP